MTITVGELLDALQYLHPDTPVFFANQPNWPFELGIESRVVVVGRDEVELLESYPLEQPEEPGQEVGQVVYLAEAAQERYLPGVVAEEFGWR